MNNLAEFFSHIDYNDLVTGIIALTACYSRLFEGIRFRGLNTVAFSSIGLLLIINAFFADTMATAIFTAAIFFIALAMILFCVYVNWDLMVKKWHGNK